MKKTIIDRENWNRNELFSHYDNMTNPFVYLTTPINITNLYKYVKNNNIQFYPTFGYLIVKVVNEIDAFRYRREGNDIILYDEIRPSFTENINGEELYFFSVPYTKDMIDFLNNYNTLKEEYLRGEHKVSDFVNGEIWLSCAPWLKFNGLITPYNKENTIPQMIWDKFEFNNENVTINLLIMAHHGFVDGFHIGKFIKLLSSEIDSLEVDKSQKLKLEKK